MVSSKPSDIGNGSRKIAISGMPEVYRPALGDGTAKPGDLVGIIAATGKVVKTVLGGGTTAETFIGIVDDKPTIAEDTAIGDGKPLNIIVPTSTHKYKVRFEDPGGATAIEGLAVGFSDTAGAMEMVATMGTGSVYGNLDLAVPNGDSIAQVEWR